MAMGNPGFHQASPELPTTSPSDEQLYDALAPHFREQSEARADYLAAVDQLVVRHISAEAGSLLDVGAGDGLRATRIAEARHLKTLVLAEPSEAMANYCRQRNTTAIWRTTAEELPESDLRFDVITCLWNVLGHVSAHEKRLTALRRMGGLLTDAGQLFLDVNNRYNARAYGWLPTFGRIIYDRVRPSVKNGDVTFNWRVDGRDLRGHGHVFTPGEMENLIRGAGLKIARRFIVDYETGQMHRSVFAGQLLYELREG